MTAQYRSAFTPCLSTLQTTVTTVLASFYPSPVQPRGNSLILMGRAVPGVVLLKTHHGTVTVKCCGEEQELARVKGEQEGTETDGDTVLTN